MSVIVRIVGAASGTPTPHDGRYLIAWNSNVLFGTLEVDSTDDPSKAKRFTSASSALGQWGERSRVQPTRPDGKKNKPLTALSIILEPGP